jgi:hypothetical protein
MRDDAINERDELDAMLDAALETYVDTEATPGLAQRILNVTSRREPRRLMVRWMPLAASALAAAVLIAIFIAHRTVSPSTTSPVMARVPSNRSGPDLPIRSSPTASSLPVRWGGRHAIKAATHPPAQSPLPRREVFPTPAPLTAEEKAVLKLENRGLGEIPAQEVRAQTVQSATQGPVEPIDIAAIHIPPLNPPDNGNN